MTQAFLGVVEQELAALVSAMRCLGRVCPIAGTLLARRTTYRHTAQLSLQRTTPLRPKPPETLLGTRSIHIIDPFSSRGWCRRILDFISIMYKRSSPVVISQASFCARVTATVSLVFALFVHSLIPIPDSASSPRVYHTIHNFHRSALGGFIVRCARP